MTQTTPIRVATVPAALEPDDLDRLLHAAEGKWTLGLSPASLWLAGLDWAIHLANAPQRRLKLTVDFLEQGLALMRIMGDASEAVVAPPADHRFSDPSWQKFPFNLVYQSFLLQERWWARATSGTRGTDPANERRVAFSARQWLDMLSPSNLPWLNPEVIQATLESGGRNFSDGFANLVADLSLIVHPADQPDFTIGRDLACTPGKVVLRNALIELIQYSPLTPQVKAPPLLIVPAWIMKYYILDLSPGNSLIRTLVAQGFTVFCISWRNPDARQSELTLDDYRASGVMAALDAVGAITGSDKVHACGYCLGGTLLTIAAAAMARDGDQRLASVTLLAAQTDFTEAGELQLFISEGQLAFLEDVMWAKGTLSSGQMAGAFQLLRSNDLIWSRMVKSYFLGRRDQPNDLMAWNSDATRMPFRMHAEYLRRMFLDNDLAEGRFPVGGRPVSIDDISLPIFMVGTETDHVAPWRSVYKMTLLNKGDITFALTSGGHNGGIVNPPGQPHRHVRILERRQGGHYIGPDEFLATANCHEGSWWPAWMHWLDKLCAGLQPPPPLGAPAKGYPALADAPGSYVLVK